MSDSTTPQPPENSLLAWLADHGVALLNGDGAVARAEDGARAITLIARALVIEADPRGFFPIRVLFALESRPRDGGEITDLLEQELFLGQLDSAASKFPVPDIASPPLSDWLSAWRSYMARRLTRLLQERPGELPMPMDVVSGRSPFNLLHFWLEEGPLKEGPPPRLSVDPTALDRALHSLTTPSLPSLRARLRGRGLPMIQAALNVATYTIVLCAGARGAELGDDRILLLDGGREPVTLLRSDDEIQNRLKYTLDGDAATTRRLLAWLSDVLVKGGLDREIKRHYIGGAERTALSTWLSFKGDNHDPEEPIYDPRLDSDLVVDEHPWWDSDDEYLPPPPHAEQERIRREDVPRYYAFLRAVLSPTFVGRLEQGA
ncbi:MAG: hypothetical protein U0441_02005 [Polyangiaceae bacterium]